METDHVQQENRTNNVPDKNITSKAKVMGRLFKEFLIFSNPNIIIHRRREHSVGPTIWYHVSGWPSD